MPVCAEVRAELPPGIVVVVEKSAFRLGVYRDQRLLDCFAVALGAEPVGDKRARGDERTPEGWFRVTHRNPKSRFHLSLGLDYPTDRHAQAAYADGRIDAATRDRIVQAKTPPSDTPLGGDIFLHGGGSWPSWWTDGCVAVADDHIGWIYATVGPGDAVLILP